LGFGPGLRPAKRRLEGENRTVGTQNIRKNLCTQARAWFDDRLEARPGSAQKARSTSNVLQGAYSDSIVILTVAILRFYIVNLVAL